MDENNCYNIVLKGMNVMEEVYIVQHCYEYEVAEDITKEDIKVIGIYSSWEKAEEAVQRLKSKEGFNRLPIDCFCIDRYEVNQDNWCDGFITYDGSTGEWIE